jgi:hypothetical protein
LVVTVIGSDVTFPPPCTPESVMVPRFTFVPDDTDDVTGVEDTFTLPAV